jgi:ABC-type transporter Mla subunit MlaD
MAKNRNALGAGIFMVLTVAAIVAIVIGIAGMAKFTTTFTPRLILFKLSDNVGGLRKGDDIRLGGLKDGTVDKIEFKKKGSLGDNNPPEDSVLVTVSLPENHILATDAKVEVETTLTGVTCLNITDLGGGSPQPADVPLAGHPDALSSFMAGLPETKLKVDKDLDKVYTTLDTYDKTGARVHDLADSGVRTLDDMHAWLGPSTGDFHGSMADIHAITGHIREKLPPITASAQQLLDHLNDVVAKAQGSMGDVKATLANTRDLTGTARSVVERNQGHIDLIVANLKKASDNIEEATVEIRASPWRLFYKPAADERANLNLYDAARQFAEGANDLNDAAVALRDSLKETQPDPAKIQKLYDKLNDQFEKFRAAEDGLWKKVQE